METRQQQLVCGHLNIWVCLRQRSRRFRGFRKYWGDLTLETEQLQAWCLNDTSERRQGVFEKTLIAVNRTQVGPS